MKINIFAKINKIYYSCLLSSGASGALEPDRRHQKTFFLSQKFLIFSTKHRHH